MPGRAACDQFKEVAVQVDWVGHHGVVDQGHPHSLVALEADGLDQLAELAAIEAPHEPLHIARQMDFHGTRRGPLVLVGGEGHQIGVDQHPVRHVLQPDRPFTQAIGRVHGDGVYADADRHVRRSVLGVAHVHSGHGHSGHVSRRSPALRRGSMIHAGHRAMVHPGHTVHRTVVHPAHAHVAHRQVRDFTQWRDLGGHAQARRQGRPAHAGTVDGFRDDGVGAVLGRPNDDVVGLRHRNLELVGLDRAHILPVGLHHRHR